MLFVNSTDHKHVYFLGFWEVVEKWYFAKSLLNKALAFTTDSETIKSNETYLPDLESLMLKKLKTIWRRTILY